MKEEQRCPICGGPMKSNESRANRKIVDLYCMSGECAFFIMTVETLNSEIIGEYMVNLCRVSNISLVSMLRKEQRSSSLHSFIYQSQHITELI